MKITKFLTILLLAVVCNTATAQTSTHNSGNLFEFDADTQLPPAGSKLYGHVGDGKSITGMLVKSSTVFNFHELVNVEVNFDNALQDSDGFARFGSIVGMELEDNMPDPIPSPHYLLSSSGAKLIITVDGGFQSNSIDLESGKIANKGDIIGFIQKGTKHSIGQLGGSDLIVNSSYIASTTGFAADNQTSIIGFSTLNAHVSSTNNSNLVITSAAIESAENTKLYSANKIVGIEGQSFDALSGSLTIKANASQNGTVTGIHINGENAELPTSQALSLSVTIAHAGEVNADNYHELIQHDNAGGRKTAYVLENTFVSNLSSITFIEGINVTSHSLHNTRVTTLGANIEVEASGRDSYGVFIDAYDNSYIDVISATIRVDNIYENNDSNVAALSMDIDRFGEIGRNASEVESGGTKSAIGYHFHTDLTTAGKQETGLIFNNLDTHVSDAPHLYDHVTTDGEAYTSKSVVGVLIENREGTAQQGVEAVLNFVDGATVETWIGVPASPSLENISKLPLGDAIIFDVETATAIAHNREDADSSVASYVSLRGDIVSRSGDTNAEFIYQSGEFNVTSDHWYVNNVSIGDDRTQTTSKVTLSPSTHPIDGVNELGRATDLSMIDVLDFHVNSDTDFSQLVIVENQLASIETLQKINVTLSTDIMKTEQFRLTLIDGDLLDTMAGSFQVTFEDINNALAGPGAYALETIVVEYDGVDYVHNPETGWIIPLTGTATDFVIKRYAGHDATIPEPSTATLSLLALAGLLARRRRRA